MARTNSPEGLFSHGYTLEAVKEWRAREYEAGRPSKLEDFLRAHYHLCVECRGNGKFAIGVCWRDKDGCEQAEEGPVEARSCSGTIYTIPRSVLATHENGIICTHPVKPVGVLI
jgi:hypothetical protein